MADELHPAVRELLRTMAEQPAPPLAGRSIESGRAMMADLFGPEGDPEPVATVEDFEIPGPADPMPVRLYLPETERPPPLVVYYHGGGFVVGDLESTDPVCRALANESSCAVLSVDYRLAPEHPFPAATEDCYAALSWAAAYGADVNADPTRLAVAGDSAGGNLSAAVSLLARDRDGPAVDHQLLIYPAVRSPVQDRFPSFDENGEGYFLEVRDMVFFTRQYHRSRMDFRNEYAWPLLTSDYAGLPSATVITAGFDPLRDEGIAYADALRADGVDVAHRNFDDMIHGFVNLVGMVDRAREAIAFGGERLRETFDR